VIRPLEGVLLVDFSQFLASPSASTQWPILAAVARVRVFEEYDLYWIEELLRGRIPLCADSARGFEAGFGGSRGSRR
jgi:hypothetical protein